MRPQMHHLPEIMSQIEGGPVIYILLVFPVERGEEQALFHSSCNSRELRDLLQPLHHPVLYLRTLLLPVDVRTQIRYWHQHIERGLTGRRQCLIDN